MVGAAWTARLRSQSGALLVALLWAASNTRLQTCEGFRIEASYVIISSPSTGNIYYSKAQSFYDHTLPREARPVRSAHVLIDGNASKCRGFGCFEGSGEGLEAPGPLAIHEGPEGAVLYVADDTAQSIYAYNVYRSSFDWLDVSAQRRVRKGVAVKGLAVDSRGDLYYTTEAGAIEMISAADLDKFAHAMLSPSVGNPMTFEPKPQQILGSADGAALASPGGLAADSFFLYWTNLPGDSNAGIVAKAPQRASANASISGLVGGGGEQAQMEAYNLCVARDNLFFTGGPRALYAVKTHGGVIAEVYTNFTEPKGCAFDRDNTLYVADEKANAVLSLPASLGSLRPIKYTSKAIDVQAPAQIALLHSGRLMTRSGAQKEGGASPALGVLTAAAVVVSHALLPSRA